MSENKCKPPVFTSTSIEIKNMRNDIAEICKSLNEIDLQLCEKSESWEWNDRYKLQFQLCSLEVKMKQLVMQSINIGMPEHAKAKPIWNIVFVKDNEEAKEAK